MIHESEQRLNIVYDIFDVGFDDFFLWKKRKYYFLEIVMCLILI